MGKVTIKDIAREAGVSISTVSNALNGVSVVKPETREYILEVADRLHYIPDLNGRNLKAKATKVLGLFTTSLKGPYFATLADIMFWECVKHGYELNIFVTWSEKSAITSILGKRVDGCVILSHDVDEEGAKRILELDAPTIFLDRELKGNRVSSIIFDSYKDGTTVADYFLKKGFRNFAVIQGVLDNYDAIERFRGFRDRLLKDGIVVDPEYILEGGFEREKARDAMAQFLEKGNPMPEAVFATNDLSAFGVMDALMEKGIKIPEDIEVVGVDDVEMCQWYTPNLTTIRTGYEKQGSLAVKKLVKMINGEEQGDIIKLHGQLIERESTKGRG
ncbi:MAG: LacI family transcriptional regulator [Acetatifactor sp.]|jgi:LacI family purine nucleotide synthesis repressor|nr:LacI family transcriptional regulator [Acetatifactor sp.]